MNEWLNEVAETKSRGEKVANAHLLSQEEGCSPIHHMEHKSQDQGSRKPPTPPESRHPFLIPASPRIPISAICKQEPRGLTLSHVFFSSCSMLTLVALDLAPTSEMDSMCAFYVHLN